LAFVREDIQKYAESKVSKIDPLLTDLERNTHKSHGICTFNDTVTKDDLVEGVLLAIREGMFLIRKR
jgi:hypothetical protein